MPVKYIRSAFLYSLLTFPASAQEELNITIPVNYNVLIEAPVQAQEDVRTTAGSAALINEKEWQDERATTIKDITDYTPSVFSQPRNGAEAARLSIRGSGLAARFQGRGLVLLQDGIPITQADGEFEFQLIDPWLIRYATVYPGANALEYGASTFGGAINLVTPTGLSQSYPEVRAMRGSFDTWHGLISAGDQKKNYDGFSAASYFSQNGEREQNEQDSFRFTGNVGYRQSDTFIHRFYLTQLNSNAEIPGTLSRAQIREDDEQGKPINVARNYSRNLDLTRLAYKNAWAEEGRRLKNAVFYTYRNLDNPVFTYIKRKSHDGGLRTKYTHEFGLDSLLAGANLYYGASPEDRFANDGGAPGAFILTRESRALTSELYIQYEKHLGRQLYGIAGVQAGYATRTIDEEAPTNQSQTEEYAALNPRIGLRWDANYNTQIFTNLSRSFEPPTLGDLSGGNSPGFKELDAQTATSFEVGGRGEWQDLKWQATYYYGWIDDELVQYAFPNGTSDTVNVDESTRQGVELALSGRVVNDVLENRDGLDLRAAYSWNRFRLDDDPVFDNNYLPGLPQHYIKAEVLYRHPAGWSFGPTFEAASGTDVDVTNSLESPGYVIYGAKANWASDDEKLSFYIEAKNLTDKTYIPTLDVVPDAGGTDGNYFYPGEGRAFYAGLRWAF